MQTQGSDLSENLYSNPAKECDIVMKGGITSGIVYPPAVSELAKVYRFKNIGGTSAGAIAAAATAAAELGRQANGFQRLEKISAELAETVPGNTSRLLSLFQPQPKTAPLFRLLLAALGNRKWKKLRFSLTLIRNFRLAALLGSLPGFLLIALFWSFAGGAALTIGILLSTLVFLAGMLIASAFSLVRCLQKNVPENYYGICSGFSKLEVGKPEPLTAWLSSLLDELADKKNGPLTFGDLWGTGKHRNINLEMMTTNLTHGRPYRLPFRSNIFYFNPEEFRKLFPKKVVDWMIAHAYQGKDTKVFEGLCAFPSARDLPVVVATRMSLSFPLLLSAVKLYAIDYSRKGNPAPEPCWFSDGGICTNFPVHFFDTPLPKRPCFAINLREFHPDYKTPVWMPKTNRGGIGEWWIRFEKNGNLMQFFSAIFNSMQNWVDNTQTKVPGYRDRIVHISLNPDEGGLNLNMPAPLITKLTGRGKLAAQEILKRYGLQPSPYAVSWPNHRWVRYRSTMALMEGMLRSFARSCRNPTSPSYRSLITNPPSYTWNSGQQQVALKATASLLQLWNDWQSLGGTGFKQGAPSPHPVQRTMPDI